MTGTGPPTSEREERPERSFGSRLARSVLPGVVRRNYALKFALALLVVVLLIAAIGIVSFVQIQEIIEDDAENTLRSTATIQADSVSEWTAGMESQTRGIAASDVYGTRDRERIRDHLRDSQTLVGAEIVGAHYVGPDHEAIVASTDPDYEGRAVATTVPAWRGPIERATNESDDRRTVATSDRAYEHNGQLLVTFARPVRVGDGVLVLVADVRQGFERLHGTDTIATTSVLNTDGHEVAAPRQTWPVALADTPAFETARQGETETHERADDVVAFAPVDGTDWIVVAEAPKSQLYEASETVGRNVGVLVASSLVALAVVGLVLGRGTVLPLIRLRERTQELEAGNFDADLRTDREDEIGRLFASFGQMRDALREQIRETEAARERAERSRREVARQNERLDQFASTVSHDLRNPLNVADGYREMLAMELAENEEIDRERHQEYVTRIDESHDRMGAIIDDVLALAREGESIDDTEEIDLEELATAAWSNVDHGEATLSVVGTRTFEGDRDRLLRALENLFRNAIEHGGSVVTVEVGPTEAGFYVADDGSGIPPDAVDEVFEYGKTTTEGGTGFGLAIVEAIVAAHDWTIEVDETVTEGATFVVEGVGVDGAETETETTDERATAEAADFTVGDENGNENEDGNERDDGDGRTQPTHDL
ncbi:sensor histidine kinase [Halobacteria archaeon AArc-m2/3/4]|uniref:histidine kinase n=1 Tax=Natronoglomus mannanivorans TaxID=2979990 RepID=A0ABT2QGQ8_9EURY|nr:sensor histidine kinase [Halobacteria archaeon AArc-m2/3/4]